MLWIENVNVFFLSLSHHKFYLYGQNLFLTRCFGSVVLLPFQCPSATVSSAASVDLFRRYKAFRDNSGNYSLFYWELLAVRLGFIIAFEVRQAALTPSFCLFQLFLCKLSKCLFHAKFQGAFTPLLFGPNFRTFTV